MPPQRPEPPPPPKLAVQDAPAEPPARPKVVETPPERPKEPTPEKPKPAHNFDPNMIAKLIGQSKPSTPALAATQTASMTPQGLPHHDAPHMSMSMASALDAWLTESYLNCWTPPPTMPEGDTYVAEIRVIFNPDGSLSGRPVSAQSADRSGLARACGKRNARGPEVRPAEGPCRIHALISNNGRSRPSISIRERPKDDGHIPARRNSPLP